MRTLLIDNYDSFTGNLYQLIWMVTGHAPVVIENDRSDFDEVIATGIDAIVISPGPGRPDRTRDFGLSARAILEHDVPILGVCLGHQGICHLYGGAVTQAREVMHGRASAVRHNGNELFSGIPSPFLAVRYHSLLASRIPECLETIAWTEADLCMAVRHRERPVWGVQFHPESIGTEHGQRLIENFFERATSTRSFGVIPSPKALERSSAEPPPRTLHARTVACEASAESVFLELFSQSETAVWLDSSMLAEGLSRVSYMADASGPHAEIVTYDVGTKTVAVETRRGVERYEESLFETLARELRDRKLPKAPLPFNFQGGYVGYLGYELKADCGGDKASVSPTPDAKLLFADRVIAIDHETREVTLLCLADEETRAEGERWLGVTTQRLATLPRAAEPILREKPSPVEPEPRHSPEAYLSLVARCQEEIQRGESYEICLTNQLRIPRRIDPVATYRTLRRVSPAPFAALLRFGDLAVLSASPERFLRVGSGGEVEARPIKGTAPRGDTPERDAALREGLRLSEKDRAENLMIVDLLRNDLGTVCERGSVHVPELFAVESYRSVHQLVSTVRGTLRSGLSATDAVRAAFPGGSMTGAPKRRTMEILDRLEGGARGVYAGALGYFSVTGDADLSIVIRTIVATSEGATVGVGGAVVALSTPEGELEETRIKARAMLEAIAMTSTERER